MKKAYLVLGPESSGTRLITRLLIDAGCFGDGDHEQRLDKQDDESKELLEEAALPHDETPVVWRRSYPHAERWVDISRAVGQLRERGYAVSAVLTTRDWFPMIQSQRNGHPHVLNEEIGLRNVRQAYRTIFRYLPEDVPFVMASYESIVRYRRRAVRKLLEMLQLLPPRLVHSIEDGNAKWYAK